MYPLPSLTTRASRYQKSHKKTMNNMYVAAWRDFAVLLTIPLHIVCPLSIPTCAPYHCHRLISSQSCSSYSNHSPSRYLGRFYVRQSYQSTKHDLSLCSTILLVDVSYSHVRRVEGDCIPSSASPMSAFFTFWRFQLSQVLSECMLISHCSKIFHSIHPQMQRAMAETSSVRTRAASLATHQLLRRYAVWQTFFLKKDTDD